MEQLTTLKNRLDKAGINVEFAANYPWIYLHKINDIEVTETFQGNHGFTVGFLPARKDAPFRFTDLKEIFKIIRKYRYQSPDAGE